MSSSVVSTHAFIFTSACAPPCGDAIITPLLAVPVALYCIAVGACGRSRCTDDALHTRNLSLGTSLTNVICCIENQLLIPVLEKKVYDIEKALHQLTERHDDEFDGLSKRHNVELGTLSKKHKDDSARGERHRHRDIWGGNVTSRPLRRFDEGGSTCPPGLQEHI
jgi:hypothetical protein